MEKRTRKSYTDEFKAAAVKLVVESGKSQSLVARDLGVVQSVLSVWVRQARADAGDKDAGLTTAERAELAELRKQVRTLTMERDFAKKAAAFFAKEIP